MRKPFLARLAAALAASAVLVSAAGADLAGDPSRVHALTGVRIVTGPGSQPFVGTVVIRDGRIEMVGADVDVPSDAILHDLAGRTLYPGWVEPYLVLEADPDVDLGDGRTTHENDRIHPEARALDRLSISAEDRQALRDAGYAVVQAVPPSGIFRGRTAVTSLGDGDAGDHILRAEHAQAFAFERSTWTSLSYPSSLMGAIALTRQTLLDAAWSRDSWSAWRRDPANVDRPAENASLRALGPVLDRSMPLFMEASSVQNLPRVLAIAREFHLSPVVVTTRSDLHLRMEHLGRWLDDADAELVASLDFPEAPEWTDDDDRLRVSLNSLVDWELAPGNLALLEEIGIDFAVTAHGLDDPDEARSRLRVAIARGLSEDVALAAVTTRPAALLGVEHRVGTIEPGKDANLIVATGDLFAKGTRIEAMWIDGVRHGPIDRRATESDVAKKWALFADAADEAMVTVEFSVGDDGLEGTVATPDSEDETAADDDDTDSEDGAANELESVSLVRGVLTFTIPDEAWDGATTHVELHRDGPFLRGESRSPGRMQTILARVARKKDEPEDLEILSPSARPWPPKYDPTDAPRHVVVIGATIWTCSGNGTLENADLLVSDGRIVSVGTVAEIPAGAVVIDGSGLHVTPGLVDCHSHSSISGGVNECTESCTAEVRVQDVVNDQSSAMYRELAGGLTVSNLLHGSCNAIGGQNAVIKLRLGQTAEELLLDGAPAGIKFALGENVKRSGWDKPEARDRYPNTRMGVEQFIRDRFLAADDYRRGWDEWRRRRSGAPPRRDLELDALVEILEGERLVHCHSYRADEIVMLIRVADDFGFRIGTFQHVLEGYKVANEIAAHGAGASAFSDWWAYKMEVVEAIPYAGEIMWRRGVTVSYNSDSSELSRRMNLEAAKAVKYGRVPEEDALNFVTRNPAIQLGIDDRVGSLEPGKDGDFVLWSAHPLSDAAICQQTWIDGVKRFDRSEDLAGRDGMNELREKLLAKAEKAGRDEDDEEGDSGDERSRGGRGARPPIDDSDLLLRGECIVTSNCCGGH